MSRPPFSTDPDDEIREEIRFYLGIYGVTAVNVGRRRREIAIRMAMGGAARGGGRAAIRWRTP